MKKVVKILLYTVLFTFLLIVLFLDFSTPPSLEEYRYYQKSKAYLDTLNFKNSTNSNGKIMVGFSKENITPNKKVRMVGYGWRDEFQGVLDSLHVSTLLIKSGNSLTAIISYDLMLVTPEIISHLKNKLKAENIEIDHFYFSATHTHSAIGGYRKGILGYVALGGYDEDIMNLLSESAKKSIVEATKNLLPLSKFSFFKIEQSSTKNRITDETRFNEYVRGVVLNNHIISTFNAHPTILKKDNNLLSNEYPSLLIEKLKKLGENMTAMFCAGAVGSVSPVVQGEDDYEKLSNFIDIPINENDSVIDVFSSSDTLRFLPFCYKKLMFPPPPLGMQLKENMRLRPWVFNMLLNDAVNKIDVLRLGDVLMVSLPCEFSAEFYPALEKYAKQKGFTLVLTSFNGSYLGYATPVKHFSTNYAETREMNWLGKYGGEYYAKIIQQIIDKQEKVKK